MVYENAEEVTEYLCGVTLDSSYTVSPKQ